MENFFSLLKTHQNLLEEKGYNEYKLEPGSFFEIFQKEFAWAVNQAQLSKEPEEFYLETVLTSKTTEDVKLKFHFKYDPSKNDLAITSLLTKLNGTKKIYLFDRSEDLLPAKVVLADVVKMSLRQKAKKTISSTTVTGKVNQKSRK